MILLEITDDTGYTHYEIFNIKPDELDRLDKEQVYGRLKTLVKKQKGSFMVEAQMGNKVAEQKLMQLNDAFVTLKSPEKREAYDEKLRKEHSSSSTVLRIQPIAPPFFWDRSARFRIIERLMQEAGMIPQSSSYSET